MFNKYYFSLLVLLFSSVIFSDNSFDIKGLEQLTNERRENEHNETLRLINKTITIVEKLQASPQMWYELNRCIGALEGRANSAAIELRRSKTGAEQAKKCLILVKQQKEILQNRITYSDLQNYIEDLEENLFPAWLLRLRLTRYQKWVVALRFCQGRQIKVFRENLFKIECCNVVNQTDSTRICTLAKYMADIMSSHGVSKMVQKKDKVFPKNDKEMEEVCNYISKNYTLHYEICKLILITKKTLFTELPSKNADPLYEKFRFGNQCDSDCLCQSEETNDAICYNVIKNTLYSSAIKKRVIEYFGQNKTNLSNSDATVSKDTLLLECRIEVHEFEDYSPWGAEYISEGPIITIQSRCPKSVTCKDVENKLRQIDPYTIYEDKILPIFIKSFPDPMNIANPPSSTTN